MPARLPSNDPRITRLKKIYSRAIKRIEQDFNSATDFSRLQRSAILGDVQRILTQLNGDLNHWADTEIPSYYLEAAQKAAIALQKAGLTAIGAGAFSLIDSQAVDVLVNQVKTGFAQSMQGVYRSAQKALTEAQKMEVNALLAEGKITGETTRKIAAEVRQYLRDNGLTALVDKSGKRWELDTYTEMLVRTTSTEAANRGLGNTLVQNGGDLVQVTITNSQHQVCRDWEGRILSMTGNTAGYPTYDQAAEDGLFHPNCQHRVVVYTPGLSDLTQQYQNPFNDLGTQTMAPVTDILINPNNNDTYVPRY